MPGPAAEMTELSERSFTAELYRRTAAAREGEHDEESHDYRWGRYSASPH